MMRAYQRKLVAGGLVFAMVAVLFAMVPMCATADTVVLHPGYVNGDIGMSGVSINNGWVWALSTDRKYNASDVDVRTGQYSLTVEGGYTYNIYAAGRYTQKTTQPYKEAYYYLGKQTTYVEVGVENTVNDMDFLAEPGYISASVDVSGGTVTDIRWYVVSSLIPTLYLLNSTQVHEWGTGVHTSITLPVLPCTNVDKNGDGDYLDTGLGESFLYVYVDVYVGADRFRPTREYIDVIAGQTATVSWEVTVTPGWITGRMDIVGMGFNRVDILGSATMGETELYLYRSLLGSSTPRDYFDYTVPAVPATWSVYPRFQFADQAQNLNTWLSLSRIPSTVSVLPNQYSTADFTVEPGYVTGTVNLNGAHATLSGLEVWGNYNREPGSPHAYTRSNTDDYQLILYPGAWQAGEPSLYVFFDNDPTYVDGAYDTSYFRYLDGIRYRYGPMLDVEAGETITGQDFTYGTALVTLNYRIEGGGLLWAPEIRSTYTYRSPTNWNDAITTLGYALGGKTPTQLGTATITLPEGKHAIVASAMTESGARAEFGRVTLDVKAGDIIEADIGAPVVTITSPTGLQHTLDTSIAVEGLVTDDTGVSTVTVNGVVVSLTDTNNPKDDNERSFSTTVSGLDDGENTITIVASDTSGKTTTVERTVIKDLTNTAPTAGLDSPYEGAEGTAIAFDASSSTDPQWDALQYRWDFDSDSNWDTDWSSSPTTSHSYPDQCTVTVTVEVSDGSLTDKATASVKILNAPPVLAIYPEYTPEEGSTISCTFSFTDTGMYDTHTATIEWGDDDSDVCTVTESAGSGSFEGTHTYSANGDYTATITIADEDGGSDTTEMVVHITEAPYVSITADPMEIDEGGTVSFSGSYSGFETDPQPVWTWDFGDETIVDSEIDNAPLDIDHQYDDEGTSGEYTASLTINQGETTLSAQTTITVNNVAPTGTLIVPDLVYEGSEATVSFSGCTDPGDKDTYSFSFDLDEDGNYEICDQSEPSATYTFGEDGLHPIKAKITDNDGSYTEYEASVAVLNVAPDVGISVDYETIDEGSSVSLIGSFTDPGTADMHEYIWDFGDGETSTDSLILTHTYANDGTYEVTLTVTDDDGAEGVASLSITVDNVAPSIDTFSVSPTTPIEVDGSIAVTVEVSDPGDDALTTTISWGDGATSSPSDGTGWKTHTYTTTGVHTVKLEVSDDEETVEAVYQYVVVYDPDGGFVTGGGWINSPAGAYAADETLTGRANFGFVSKYKAGATEPTGNVEFQFKVGSLNFHSSDFDWLVVAGTKAMFKGTGTINGEGNYGFQISAIDGDPKGDADTFRIKIWDKDNSDAVVYDNQMDDADDADPTTELAGGQIVVHKGS